MWDGSSNGESIQNGEPNSFSTKKRERSVSISALLVVVAGRLFVVVSGSSRTLVCRSMCCALLVVVAGRLFVVACVVRSGIWSEQCCTRLFAIITQTKTKNASKWLAFPFRIERGNNLKVVNVTASGCTVPSSWGFRMPCHNII